jgi:hypothetical protein
VKNEDRLSLAQMERLRAELRPNLVFVLELVRRELDELRVERELIRRELEDIQALLHDMTQRNAAGRLWWFAVALVVACCGASHAAAQRRSRAPEADFDMRRPNTSDRSRGRNLCERVKLGLGRPTPKEVSEFGHRTRLDCIP